VRHNGGEFTVYPVTFQTEKDEHFSRTEEDSGEQIGLLIFQNKTKLTELFMQLQKAKDKLYKRVSVAPKGNQFVRTETKSIREKMENRKYTHEDPNWTRTHYWFINNPEWEQIMSEGVKELDANKICWGHMQQVLAPSENPDAFPQDRRINFHNFLDLYKCEHPSVNAGLVQNHMGVKNLYRNQKIFKKIFQWMDTNDDGTITKLEWVKGCQLLNNDLPENDRIENPEELYSVFDFNKSGNVDFNEFFEGSRLARVQREQQLMHLDPEESIRLDERNVDLRSMGWTARSPAPANKRKTC